MAPRTFVNAEQVMRFIDRAEPEMSDTKKAAKMNKSPKRLYAMRHQKTMLYDTAEDVLDAFDLGYLLHTGDIDIIEKPVKRSLNDHIKELQSMNREVRERLTEMRHSRYHYSRQARDWCFRAKELEKALRKLDPDHPSLSPSKDSVKRLAVPTVRW